MKSVILLAMILSACGGRAVVEGFSPGDALDRKSIGKATKASHVLTSYRQCTPAQVGTSQLLVGMRSAAGGLLRDISWINQYGNYAPTVDYAATSGGADSSWWVICITPTNGSTPATFALCNELWVGWCLVPEPSASQGVAESSTTFGSLHVFQTVPPAEPRTEFEFTATPSMPGVAPEWCGPDDSMQQCLMGRYPAAFNTVWSHGGN
jgi:hypothetical protein